VAFTVIFGKFVKLLSDGDAPYANLEFVAMLLCYFLSKALSCCGESFLVHSSLIARICFLRLTM
jgi:hypothetical protein